MKKVIIYTDIYLDEDIETLFLNNITDKELFLTTNSIKNLDDNAHLDNVVIAVCIFNEDTDKEKIKEIFTRLLGKSIHFIGVYDTLKSANLAINGLFKTIYSKEEFSRYLNIYANNIENVIIKNEALQKMLNIDLSIERKFSLEVDFNEQ